MTDLASLQAQLALLRDEKQQLEKYRQLYQLQIHGIDLLLSAASHSELFQNLFSVIGQVTPFSAALLINQQQSGAQHGVLTAWPEPLPGLHCDDVTLQHLLSSAHKIDNVARVPWWPAPLLTQFAHCQSALSLPLSSSSQRYVLLLLAPGIGAFSADALQVLRSFSTFISSTLAQLEQKRLLSERDELLAQQQRLAESMVRQEKMASIGLLAAGVAHELNNPLGFIYSNLHTFEHYLAQYREFITVACRDSAALRALSEQLKLDYLLSDSADLLAESLQGARRSRDIIQSLRNFSHPDQHNIQPVDLVQLIGETVRMASSQFRHQTKLTLELPAKPALVMGNPVQLSQLLLNLLLNAHQAIRRPAGLVRLSLIQQSHWWQLRITDNGEGISAAAQQQIFAPFFTTKPVGQGSGLGLSISRAFAEQHGGTLTLEQSSADGSCFLLSLPECAG